MRIGMIGYHGCIRTFKEARALMKRGHQVEMYSHYTFAQTFGFGKYDLSAVYTDDEQLVKEIKGSKADIFHVHNEPDWMVALTKENADGRPVVYDVHDLESMRWMKEPDEDERDAFEAADGIIHVSEPIQEYAEQHHGGGKPTIILHSYVNEEFIGNSINVSWSSMVYEGGLTSEPRVTNQGEVNYRNYREVVKAFREQGFSVYLFGAGGSTGMERDEVYEQMGAFVVRNLFYPQMMIGLRAFGFGFAGAAATHPLMEAAMPNKIFEYIASGVVPVCMNHKYGADFCERHGVGIRLNGLDNLVEQLANGPSVRENILKKRGEFAMENHIHKLEELYQQL